MTPGSEPFTLDETESPSARQSLAEAVRTACLDAAREGYEQAAIAGLCHEGAVEASLGAIRMLDLRAVVAAADKAGKKKT